MESEHIYVKGDDRSVAEAMAIAEQYAGEQGLDGKEARRIRLLSEELLGLLRGITEDDYEAMFWLEGSDQMSRVHLTAKITMTVDRRRELLASARSGKNEAAAGVIGRIRDVIAEGFLRMNEPARQEAGLIYDGVGMEMLSSGAGATLAWSLSSYRVALEHAVEPVGEAPENREPWDELERSIIANLADDVRVSIRGDDVEIVAERSVGK